MTLDIEAIREIVRSELPRALHDDPAVRRAVWQAAREDFADKRETESRFDQLLEELRRDREEQTRKWDEQAQRWDEQTRKWDEQAQRWDEQTRRWNDQARLWDEQNRKWDENQRVINQILEEIRLLNRKHDSTMGALGARWGLQSEETFRSALRGILQDSFGVQVINVNEWDDTGEVFGRPDQVELDLIIFDGALILCEIKSSMSKGDMIIFDRKTRWYEKQHARPADRRVVISPMVDPRAAKVARELGIEIYSYAEDVRP